MFFKLHTSNVNTEKASDDSQALDDFIKQVEQTPVSVSLFTHR